MEKTKLTIKKPSMRKAWYFCVYELSSNEDIIIKHPHRAKMGAFIEYIMYLGEREFCRVNSSRKFRACVFRFDGDKICDQFAVADIEYSCGSGHFAVKRVQSYETYYYLKCKGACNHE